MDCSDKDGLFHRTENSYRKTPVSRSIKQNGQFLFSSSQRRTPITHYIPPHRRKNFVDHGSFSSKRSDAEDRAPVKVFDQRNLSVYTKDNFNHEFNGKDVITQESNRKSVITQEINRNNVITQETNRENFIQQFNEESDEQTFNRDYVTQEINQEGITEEFNQESLRPTVNRENNQVFNQESFKQKFNRKRIIPDINKNHKQRTSRENITQNINQISTVEKVSKLANHFMNSEFKQILCDIYFDEYKEKLPTQCLNAIKFCVQLDLDSINDFLDAESHIEQNNEGISFLKDKEDYRSEDSLLCQEEISKPKVLELKDIGEEFWILIFNCDSFINIWGTIMDADHFGKVEELAGQMKNFYQFKSKIQKLQIEENSYYAVFDGSWHRVQCIKCNESTAEVFFIDRGDRDYVSIDRLFNLDPTFFKLPAQAINMSLSDLEIFTDCDSTHKMLDKLLFEKAVYAIVKVSNEEKNPCLSVQLYKTEDNQTINVNELLMKKLFETVLNPLYYIQEGNPEHIEFIQTNETGLFIQLNTTSLKYFKLLMEILIKNYCYDKNLKRQKVVRFEGNKIYFVKRSRDNKFYRARVLKFKNENTIEVLLIDRGIVTFINREDFFALEKLSTVLAQYPAQAVEVKLDQITLLSSKILDHLHALTSNSNELYAKFLKSEENNNIPIIRLYKKVHGYLISVNDAILIEHNNIFECKSTISEYKPKSIEGNFVESKPKSAKGNLDENKPKSPEGNFNESKQKSVESNFNQSKPKLPEDNLKIKQKSTEGRFDELFKNNFFAELERLKAYETELTRFSEEVDCMNMNISGLLSPPVVPKGSYFDVHVTIAKDPSCFVIQLLKSKSVELKKMMHDMRTVYVNYGGPKLTYKSVSVGQIYAYRCESNSQMWYRVYLLKIKNQNVATVYYCDYGCYKDVNIENLTCLQREFFSLSYQAIWAELYGVKPVSSQFWTAEACSRFKELIESKNFVCYLKSIKNVTAMNRCKAVPVTVETIYVVKLIDTSTDEDLYIADMLINDGQALRKNSN